jgi:hypothetical protein
MAARHRLAIAVNAARLKGFDFTGAAKMRETSIPHRDAGPEADKWSMKQGKTP